MEKQRSQVATRGVMNRRLWEVVYIRVACRQIYIHIIAFIIEWYPPPLKRNYQNWHESKAQNKLAQSFDLACESKAIKLTPRNIFITARRIATPCSKMCKVSNRHHICRKKSMSLSSIVRP